MLRSVVTPMDSESIFRHCRLALGAARRDRQAQPLAPLVGMYLDANAALEVKA